MNKSLIAAAVAAGLMVPGLAAADVKIFGVIQAETGNIDIDQGPGADTDDTVMGGGSGNGATFGGGPNQIGFKGTEKLGNGLTAYFKLNFQFDTFNSTGGFGDRDRFVGLKGKGWHVQFGEMNSLYKTSSHKYDPLVATGVQFRARGAVSAMHNGYMEDAMEIGFKSGNWSGGFQLSWEDASGEANDGDALGLGGNNQVDSGTWAGRIKYKQKAWEASFSMFDTEYDTGSNVDGDTDGWKVAAKWKGNGWTVAGQYESLDSSGTIPGLGSRADGGGRANGSTAPHAVINGGNGRAEGYDALAVYVSYAMSKSTSIHGAYANSDHEDLNGVAGSDMDADHWTIGVTHKLSKRTSIYGAYGDSDYDYDGATPDEDWDAWVIGLRHKF